MSLCERDVLGMRLEDALEILRRGGAEPEVIVSRAPRREADFDGTLRVVRVRGNQLTVCAFMDGTPN